MAMHFWAHVCSLMTSIVKLDTKLLQLNCWVFGEDPNSIFPVKIVATKTVSTLKDAVKEKKQPVLNHIAASMLVLWKVSIPNNDSLKTNISKLVLVDEGLLLATAELLEFFLETPIQKHLHVIIKALSAAEFAWLLS